MWIYANWFQIVFLREDSQEYRACYTNDRSCELISNCIFTWGFTSEFIKTSKRNQLWIDFKLYFYVRIHKFLWIKCRRWLVVNWFQIVFLREDSQGFSLRWKAFPCCELISNCIFTWGFTRWLLDGSLPFQLWIDFKLYFYVRIHKRNTSICSMWWVVNWFQIVFLREDSQDTNLKKNV